MATTRVWDGVHREDWQDTVLVNGGTTVTINTDIGIESTAALDDVDVDIDITSVVGYPVVSTPVKSIVSGLLRVVFQNTAAAGNQLTWFARIARNHSICR